MRIGRWIGAHSAGKLAARATGVTSPALARHVAIVPQQSTWMNVMREEIPIRPALAGPRPHYHPHYCTGSCHSCSRRSYDDDHLDGFPDLL